MKSFKIDDIEKNTKPFSVPDGYFEDLPMKIQSRIEGQKKESWFKTPAFRLTVSFASVALVAVTAFIFLSDSPTPDELLADISHEDLLAYVDQEQLEESDILSAFEVSAEDIDFFGSENLEDIDIEDGALDDLLIEYDLSDEYL